MHFLKNNMIDLLKTYIKYILFHRWNKVSKEMIDLLNQHWVKKPTKGLKLNLYNKIIQINNI